MPILEPDEFDSGKWTSNFRFRSCFPVGHELILEFLHETSRRVLNDKSVRAYPDLVTFGYFCRKANLERILTSVSSREHRFGWGTILHIAPSNIPINFAYSLLMGLLPGNSNIVRLPSKKYPQNQILLDILEQTLKEDKFRELQYSIIFCRTHRNSLELQKCVSQVDGLVVWGGDATVNEFRKLFKKPRCVEVYFPNRVSSAVLHAQNYLELSADARMKLARGFYNDTYLVDQNACSSPSTVFWIGDEDQVETAKTIFWSELQSILDKEYKLDPVARIDKMLDILRINVESHHVVNVAQHSRDIWLVKEPNVRHQVLRFGTFLELRVMDLDDIYPYIRKNEQTLCFFGVEGDQIFNMLKRHPEAMVDRIVPIGKALDIGIQWDGKSVLETLARKIEIGKA